MATVYSVEKTKWDQDVPSKNIDPTQFRGRLRVAHATYEATALATTDDIEMFNLPNDARVIDGYLFHDALGASTTLSVGHNAYTDSSGATVALDDAHYLAATATTAAGRQNVAATLALGGGEKIDADETGMPVAVHMGGAAGTGTITLVMRYVVD